MSAEPKVRPITAVLRHALWEAHGRKCSYDGEPIAHLSEMEVDHVLPEFLWRGDPRLGTILEKLELPTNYHPDSLDNLLPCRKGRNRQKADWVFEEGTIRFFRGLAAKHQEDVEEWCRKIETDAKRAGWEGKFEAMCAADETLRKKLLEALAVTPQFDTKNEVEPTRVSFARSRVMLGCDLPRGDEHGTVTIRINTLYLHTVQFVFEGAEILEDLFRGFETPPPLEQRGFIVRRVAEGADEWIVRLNRAAIILTREELAELSEVVDLTMPHVLNALLERERADDTLRFAPDGPRNVKLLRIKRALWQRVLEFAREHDYEKGTSAWHIFDAHGWGHIKMVRRNATGIVPFEAYVSVSSPERESWGPMVLPEDEVILCWDEGSSYLHSDESEERGWTAAQTFAWLTEKLIPEVVRRTKDRKLQREFRMDLAADNRARYFSPEFTGDLVPVGVGPTWADLSRFADAAQVLYHTHSREPAPRAVVESALAGVELLTDGLPIAGEHLTYIGEKMRASSGSDARQLIASGHDWYLARLLHRGSDVDNILRVAHAILEDHANKKDQLELACAVLRAWQPLIRAAHFEAIRHRTIGRLRQPEYL